MKALFKNKKYDIPEGYQLKQSVLYDKQLGRYLWCPKPKDLFYQPIQNTIYEYLRWVARTPQGLCSIDGFGYCKIKGKRKELLSYNINIRECIPIERVEKMNYKYYKTKYKRLDPTDVFVLVDNEPDINGEVAIYTPIGQHSGASPYYIKNDCKEISLETYLKVSEGIYTPEEYIGKE